MNLVTRLAVGRRSVTLLLASALFVLGIVSWGSLKQELLPDVSFPIVTVIAPYPGAGASDVSDQVVEPLEQAVKSVEGLDQLRSTSTNSIAVLVAQFDYGANLDDAVASIEENVRRAALPDGVSPTVQAFNFTSAPVVVASVSASGSTDLAAAAAIARTEIVPELLALPGVTAAEVAGGLEDRLVITLDPAKVAAAGVSLQQVTGVLQANNLTLPGGELPTDEARIPVSTIGRYESVSAIRSLVVGAQLSPTGGQPTPITLGSLGTVEVQSVAASGFGRTNGQPALTIAVSKQSAANTVTVAEDVEAVLEAAAARHAGEIEVATVANQATFILDSSDGLLREGGLGAIFAVLTIFLFLFSIRSTMVAAVSIPLSILTALVVMGAAGITLNILTLGGLAVAVGRVVDDSIVVLENIYRHRALGDDRLTSVLQGPREVAGAITASTVTTIAVFLPLGFAGGFVSQFFLAFSLTVTFALAASLVVALTVVPVLGYLIIGRVSGSVDESGEPKNSLWVRLYDPTIRLVLRNRWTAIFTVVVASGLFLGSMALVPSIPTAFVNSGSEKIVQISVDPPSGATSDQVLERATAIETMLLADPEVELVATSVPSSEEVGFTQALAATAGRAANGATMVVRLAADADLEAKIAQLSDELSAEAINGFDISVGMQGGQTSNSLQVIISASDPEIVATTATAVRTALERQSGLANIASDLAEAAPEVDVRVDPSRAIGFGLTAAQIGTQVRAALVATTLGRVQLDGTPSMPLVIKVDTSSLDSLDALKALPITVANPALGVASVPLGQLADVSQANVQARITRIDGSPAATVSADITSGDTGATSTAVENLIQDLRDAGEIPAAATVSLGGVTAQQREAFGGLFTAMAIAILLVYVTMVIAFNSIVSPFIILFSLPLATIGAFPLLLVTGRPLGISALIGFLMLIGIVVTNAIVLLDLVERLRADGHPTRDALIEGGRTRIRPILMTAIATILALVPLAAGFNEGSIIAAELGTVVIGGLTSSTFLTLIVIPAIYLLVDGLRQRLRRPPAAGSAAEAAS